MGIAHVDAAVGVRVAEVGSTAIRSRSALYAAVEGGIAARRFVPAVHVLVALDAAPREHVAVKAKGRAIVVDPARAGGEGVGFGVGVHSGFVVSGLIACAIVAGIDEGAVGPRFGIELIEAEFPVAARGSQRQEPDGNERHQRQARNQRDGANTSRGRRRVHFTRSAMVWASVRANPFG